MIPVDKSVTPDTEVLVQGSDATLTGVEGVIVNSETIRSGFLITNCRAGIVTITNGPLPPPESTVVGTSSATTAVGGRGGAAKPPAPAADPSHVVYVAPSGPSHNIDSPPDRVEVAVNSIGIGFLFAPVFHRIIHKLHWVEDHQS